MHDEMQNKCKQLEALTFKVDKLTIIKRLVTNKVSNMILLFLVNDRRNMEGWTVTDLYIKFRTEQSVMSQALKLLRAAGLVSFKKEGKYKRYRINMQEYQRIDLLLKQL